MASGYLGIAVFWWDIPAQTAQDSLGHQVTVTVPRLISIQSQDSSFELTFGDFIKGTQSNVKRVKYSVKANQMTEQSGALQASLDSYFDGVTLRADVISYQKLSGNGKLAESSPAGFKDIKTSGVNLCDSQRDSGNGKILVGEVEIDYVAVADKDLSSGTQNRTLTLTFVDA